MVASSAARRLRVYLGISAFVLLIGAPALRAQTTTYSLHVDASLGGYVTAPGINCGDGGRTDCDETYSAQTTVTLQATPSPGYELAAWTAQCTDGNPTATVLVDGARRCTAAFTPAPGGNAPADPMLASATLFTDRVGSTTPPRRGILFGTDVTMEFSSGSCCGPGPVTFSLPEYGYSITFGWSTPGDYEEAYENPHSGFPLLRITGCTGSVGRFRIYEATFTSGLVTSFAADFEALCSAPANQPRVAGAVRFNSSRARILPFDGEYPLYKLSIDPTVNGIVTTTGIDCGPGHADCTETYSSPTWLVLVATPLPGYRFIGWSGDCEGGSRAVVAVDRARRCSAVFNAVIPGLGLDDTPAQNNAFMIIVRPPNQPARRQVWVDARLGIVPGFDMRAQILEVPLPDGTMWRLDVRPPFFEAFQTGVLYENVTPVSQRAPNSAALEIQGPMGSCSPVSGRFIFYDWVVHSETNVDVSLDFECTRQDGTTFTGSFRKGSARTVLTPFAPSTFTPVPGPARPDVNRDGSPDLVWRHRTSGHNAVWMLNGVDAILSTLLEPSGAAQVSGLDWEIRAAGDMNGDGNPDLIWQNNATGQIAVWFLSGATRTGTNYLFTADGSSIESSLDWKIAAAGDMDRDGYVDLLWRHRVSGAMRLWHMQGIVQWDSVPFGTVSDLGWQIAGLADMNRDGLLDIVWRHYGSGAIASWFMYDTLFQAAAHLSRDLTDLNWRLAGVADMNADGHPDLVWQNTSTRGLAVWFLNGMTMIAGRYLNPPTVSDADWRIAAVR